MIPKDKAQELVSSFMSIKNIKLSDYSVIYLPTAKQCALIAVNEIINSRKQILVQSIKFYEYWKEVKQEIEKL